MPQQTHIIISYSEIGLKGQNRPFFCRALQKQIQQRIPKTTKIEFAEQRFILSHGDSRTFKNLQTVFGIAKIALAHPIAPAVNAMARFLNTHNAIIPKSAKTFRISVRRADKTFPTNSPELEKILGQTIVDSRHLRVNLKNPDCEIFVDILPKAAFIYTNFDTREGLRGLPVGSSGKILSLFSGGIDSPVSSWLMMKRGCSPSYLHFHAFRSLKEIKESKIDTLFKKLAAYHSPSRAFFLPFSHFQAEILHANPRYELLLFRRFMIKAAEALAQKIGFEALVMGDNLGQVASQTLPYLTLTDRGVALPILRPLIAMTKEEIITRAKNIGTFEYSIQSYKDCCSIVAAHPTLSPKEAILARLEKEIQLPEIIEKTLEEVEEKEYMGV